MTIDNSRRYFGVWSENDYVGQPSVALWVNEKSKVDDIDKVLRYLKESVVVVTIPVACRCVLCEKKVATVGWQSDGVWLWPTSLYHYVSEHHVTIPERMQENMRSNGYRICPENEIDLDRLDWPFGQPGQIR